MENSLIKPIHKGGENIQVTNYRPISIISIISKLFESIVSKKRSPIFKNLIIDVQHGFTIGRSTTTNLLVFQPYVLEAFNLKQGTKWMSLYRIFENFRQN